MTPANAAGNDTRIARLLARRGAPGSFAYAAFTALALSLTGLWREEPVWAGVFLGINLLTGVVRRRLSLGFDRIYPTHFGAVDDPAAHLARVRPALVDVTRHLRAMAAHVPD